MEYKRVSDRLAGYWDKPWSELPNQQRQAWREVMSFTDTDSVAGLCQPMELILWDDLDPQGRQIAASCHDAQHDPADEQERSMAFQGGHKETTYNGQAIKWRYWTSFRTLTAYQFSCLANALDPDVVAAGQTLPTAAKALQNAKMIERIALNHGKNEAPALDWLEWASEQRLQVYWRFRLELEKATVARIPRINVPFFPGEKMEPVQAGQREVPKPHILYLARLHKSCPSARAGELLRKCKEAVKDEQSPFHMDSPFQLYQNQLALKGTQRPVTAKTFANWVTEARKLAKTLG